jgi:hypothetical protein
MGTSGSYSGSGGKPGKDLRDDVGNWLDSLPDSDGSDPQPDDTGDDRPHLPPESLLHAVELLRPRGSGSGGGGAGGVQGAGGGAGGGGRSRSGGGPQRSATRSAATAGRAAAAALAYRSGDAAELARLGLDYEELRTLDDPLEVTRRIVDAACGAQGESTIEDHEQRYVAAQVAEWVLEHGDGATLSPEEIVRTTLARIIEEIVASETGELIRQGQRPAWATQVAESEIREAAEILAERARFSVNGVTEDEFARAIEEGVETLRSIMGGVRR